MKAWHQLILHKMNTNDPPAGTRSDPESNQARLDAKQAFKSCTTTTRQKKDEWTQMSYCIAIVRTLSTLLAPPRETKQICVTNWRYLLITFEGEYHRNFCINHSYFLFRKISWVDNLCKSCSWYYSLFVIQTNLHDIFKKKHLMFLFLERRQFIFNYTFKSTKTRIRMTSFVFGST